MKLKLIGKNTDDVGKQLEEIVARILKHKGVVEIYTNVVGSGANELDVTGNYLLPTGQKRKVICECKAYSRPINLPDWEKFCGKIYLEKSRQNGQDVYGMFIAFSGINGNVKGSYDELTLSNDNIKILSGEDLYNQLVEIFALKTAEEIIPEIPTYTNRKYSEVFLTFYNSHCYWVIQFVDKAYSILTGDGLLLDDSVLEVNNLFEAVKWVDNEIKFINLKEDSEREKNLKNAISGVICSFIEAGSSLNTTKIGPYTEQVNADLVQEAIEILTKDKILINAKKDSLKLNTESKRLEILKKLFVGQFHVKVLSSPNYEDLINETSVELMLGIQNLNHLDSFEKKEVLRVLRLSPTAINYSIVPDQMLVNNVNDPAVERHENVLKFKKDHFFLNLYNCLKRDFHNKVLANYYLSKNNIDEMEEQISFRVKSKNEILLEREIIDRTGIGQLEDERKVLIKLLPGVEIPNLKDD